MRTGARLLLAAIAFCAFVSPPGAAESNKDARLKDVERKLSEGRKKQIELGKKSAGLSKELRTLRRALVAAAKSTQNKEARVTRFEKRLGALETNARAKRVALARQRSRLSGTLVALERLALYPPGALIAFRTNAHDMVRSAILLRAVVPQLEARAAALKAQIEEIAALSADIVRQRRQVGTAGQDLSAERARLAKLIAKKSRLRRRNATQRRRTKIRLGRLSREAKDLRDLLARIEAGQATPRAGTAKDDRKRSRSARPRTLRAFSASRGGVRWPVRGKIVRRFGQSSGGGFSKGIVVTSRPAAQVVAPFDGKVVFAGNFRGYGRILIIEHSGGYHTLLAGLTRIDATVNQWLLAGEPVGVMGSTSTSAPTIYMEIRHKGRPIDPLPWLAADNVKVTG